MCVMKYTTPHEYLHVRDTGNKCHGSWINQNARYESDASLRVKGAGDGIGVGTVLNNALFAVSTTAFHIFFPNVP